MYISGVELGSVLEERKPRVGVHHVLKNKTPQIFAAVINYMYIKHLVEFDQLGLSCTGLKVWIRYIYILLYNLTILCLNGTLSYVDFMDVMKGDTLI